MLPDKLVLQLRDLAIQNYQLNVDEFQGLTKLATSNNNSLQITIKFKNAKYYNFSIRISKDGQIDQILKIQKQNQYSQFYVPQIHPFPKTKQQEGYVFRPSHQYIPLFRRPNTRLNSRRYTAIYHNTSLNQQTDHQYTSQIQKLLKSVEQQVDNQTIKIQQFTNRQSFGFKSILGQYRNKGQTFDPNLQPQVYEFYKNELLNMQYSFGQVMGRKKTIKVEIDVEISDDPFDRNTLIVDLGDRFSISLVKKNLMELETGFWIGSIHQQIYSQVEYTGVNLVYYKWLIS